MTTIDPEIAEQMRINALDRLGRPAMPDQREPQRTLNLIDALRTAEAAAQRVRDLTYASTDGTEWEHNGHAPAWGEAECPGCWVEGIRRALDGDA